MALGEENIGTHATFYKLLYKLTSGGNIAFMKDNSNQLTIELGSLPYMEKQIISQAIKLIRGNRSEMAKILGISRTTLWKKLKELKLSCPNNEQMSKLSLPGHSTPCLNRESQLK